MIRGETYIIRLNAPSGSGNNPRPTPYFIPSRRVSHLKSLFPSSANEDEFVRNTQIWMYRPEVMRLFYRKHRPAFDKNLHQQNLTYTINHIKPAPLGLHPIPRQQDPKFKTNNKFVYEEDEIFALYLPADFIDNTPHQFNVKYMEDFQLYVKENLDSIEQTYETYISFWKKFSKDQKRDLIYFAQNDKHPTNDFAKSIGLNNIKELQKAIDELKRVSYKINKDFANRCMMKIKKKEKVTLKAAFEKWPDQIEEFLHETSSVGLSTTVKAHFHEKEKILRKIKKSTNGVEEVEKEVESAQNPNGANKSQSPNNIEPLIEQALGSTQTSQPMVSDGSCSKNIRTSTMTVRQTAPYFPNIRSSKKRQRVPDTQILMIRQCIDDKFDEDMRQYMEGKNEETMKILQKKFNNWNIDWETHKKVILVSIPSVATGMSAHSQTITELLKIPLTDAQSLVNMKARIDEKLRNDFIKENFDKITFEQKRKLENAFDKCNLDFVEFKRDVSHMKLSIHVIDHFFYVRNKQRNVVKVPKGNEDTEPSRIVQRAAENFNINNDDQHHYEFPEPNRTYLSYTDDFGFHIPRGENSPDHTESSRATSSSSDKIDEANTALEEVVRSEPPQKMARHKNHGNFPAQQRNASEPSQIQKIVETQRKIIDIDEVFVDSESSSENPDNSETDEHQQDFESPTAFEQPINDTSTLHAIEDEVMKNVQVEAPNQPEREESHTTELELPVDEPSALHEDEDGVFNDSPVEAASLPEREEFHFMENEQPIDELSDLHEYENENGVMNEDPLEKVPIRQEIEDSHLTELEQPIDEPSALHAIENEVINDDPLEAQNRQEREESPDIIYLGTDAYTGPAPRPAPSIPEFQRKPRLVPESILTRIPDGATEEWELWTREQVLQWSSLFLDTEGQRFYMKKKNFTGLSMAEFLDKKDWDDFDSRSPINGIYISLRANLNRIINHRNGWTHD